MLRLGWGGVANWSEGKRAARVDCTRLAQNHVKYSMKWCRRHKRYQVKYQRVTLFRQASKIENHFFSLNYVLGGSPQSRLILLTQFLPYTVLNSLGWTNPQTRFRGTTKYSPVYWSLKPSCYITGPINSMKTIHIIYVVLAINPIVVLYSYQLLSTVLNQLRQPKSALFWL